MSHLPGSKVSIRRGMEIGDILPRRSRRTVDRLDKRLSEQRLQKASLSTLCALELETLKPLKQSSSDAVQISSVLYRECRARRLLARRRPFCRKSRIAGLVKGPPLDA